MGSCVSSGDSRWAFHQSLGQGLEQNACVLLGNGLLPNPIKPKPEAAWLKYAVSYRVLYLGFNLADMAGSTQI